MTRMINSRCQKNKKTTICPYTRYRRSIITNLAMNPWISWSGLNPHNPSKSVRAMAISGLWFGSLYTWRISRHKRLFDRNKVPLNYLWALFVQLLCMGEIWVGLDWQGFANAQHLCRSELDSSNTFARTYLSVYISNHNKIAPSQHLEKEGKLIAKLCPALLPKKLRLRGDKVAQQLPGGCQTSWSWTKVLSKLAKNTIFVLILYCNKLSPLGCVPIQSSA